MHYMLEMTTISLVLFHCRIYFKALSAQIRKTKITPFTIMFISPLFRPLVKQFSRTRAQKVTELLQFNPSYCGSEVHSSIYSICSISILRTLARWVDIKHRILSYLHTIYRVTNCIILKCTMLRPFIQSNFTNSLYITWNYQVNQRLHV